MTVFTYNDSFYKVTKSKNMNFLFEWASNFKISISDNKKLLKSYKAIL